MAPPTGTLPPAPARSAHAPPTAADRAPGAPSCPNCGAEAPERYCPRCGQEQHDVHRSMRSILGEALDAFAGWDAKIPATVGTLLLRPGRLTREYLDGRRTRYLRPLRLYLTLSVLLFLALRYGDRAEGIIRVGGTVGVEQEAAAPAPPTGARPAAPTTFGEAVERARTQPRGAAALDSSQLGEFLAHRPGEGQGGAWQRFKLRFKDRLRELGRMPTEQRQRVLQDAFLAKLGKMFFCLLPVFALLLRALYLRSPLYYAEHFVFALHVHAFAMAALTAAVLLPRGVGVLPVLWIPPYLFIALRAVYGGSRARTAAKFAALGATYFVALVAATTVTGLAAILLG